VSRTPTLLFRRSERKGDEGKERKGEGGRTQSRFVNLLDPTPGQEIAKRLEKKREGKPSPRPSLVFFLSCRGWAQGRRKKGGGEVACSQGKKEKGGERSRLALPHDHMRKRKGKRGGKKKANGAPDQRIRGKKKKRKRAPLYPSLFSRAPGGQGEQRRGSGDSSERIVYVGRAEKRLKRQKGNAAASTSAEREKRRGKEGGTAAFFSSPKGCKRG